MLGAAPIPMDRAMRMFAINSTYDFRTNGTRSGLVISVSTSIFCYNIDSPMLAFSISHNISL